MHFLKNIFNKKRGQAFTEYVIILAFVGLVVSLASVDMFKGVQRNYYTGMTPISNVEKMPPPPEGDIKPPTIENKPVAKIFGPTNAKLGETVVFNDISYVNGKGYIRSTSWGTKTLSRTFPNEGTFTITLDVIDDKGQRSSTSHTITVGNRKPVAAITSTSGNTLKTGQGFNISGITSSDPDGDKIEGWEWNMVDSSGKKTRMNWLLSGYTFKDGELPYGTYKFELRVQDSYQAWSTTAVREVKYNRPPSAPTITISPSTASFKVEDIIKITASGSVDPDGDTITYVWSGRLAESSKYPPGKHTITVVAKDAYGNVSPQAATTFNVIDPDTGKGGVVLKDANTTIIEELPEGAYATSYTFNVPSVSGHSGNDYAYVKAFNKNTGKWDQVAYQSVRNGVLLKGVLIKNTYTKVEFFYYATHCMYGKSNITYSVDYEFPRDADGKEIM